MPSLTIASPLNSESHSVDQLLALSAGLDPSIVLLACSAQSIGAATQTSNPCRHLEADLATGEGIARLVEATKTDFLLFNLPHESINLIGGDLSGGLWGRAIERMVQVAQDSGAGLVYSDFRELDGNQLTERPLIDYQLGSLRDTFDFGGLVLLSRRALDAAAALELNGSRALKWGGFYDLRLRLSTVAALFRIPEPLYIRKKKDLRDSGKRQFDYVDPSGRQYQIEMEQIVTNHLRRIGAYLEPSFEALPKSEHEFPVHASVIIPVRNRVKTIGDAVRSAISQQTDFSFNVIVVDNHSTDGTTEVLRDLAAIHKNIVLVVPASNGLGIGGCWNEGVYSPYCGRIAVQLDSDDVYSSPRTLETIAAKFDEGPYAMVIGSYTITDFNMREVPPGLIDHREWTRENGRNNALRINGLGAPRAFYVPILRKIGFPNTSYGEDYAVGLKISRDYEIGRIFDSLYSARRWDGNSDALLDVTTQNRYDLYKDRLRTVEIAARQRRNGR
jgi:hypothetical protein